MIEATLAEAAAAVGGEISGAGETRFRGVSTDSRKILPGSLFVALRGPSFDGNQFVSQALAAGAVAAIVDSEAGAAPRAWEAPRAALDGPAIRVADTLRALGDLAAWHRRRFPLLAVVGITGTSGKTTTKELLASVVRLRRRVVATEGNFNNLVGLPLTIFRISPKTETAILEMGMSVPGEIARLAEIAGPQIGIVTNCGPGHLEGLGSVENVAREKGALLAATTAAGGATAPGGTAVLDRDAEGFSLLAPMVRGRLMTVGTAPEADRRILGVRSHGMKGTTFLWRGAEIRLRLAGRHFVSNAALAAAAAEELGLDVLDIWQGLPMVRPREGRGRLVEAEGVNFFDDAYNANPLSFRAALALLGESEVPHEGGRAARKFIVMGDMLELGPAGPEWHREIGRCAARTGAAELWAIGPLSREAVAAAKEAGLAAEWFASPEALLGKILAMVRPGDLVLVKGSHGMRLDAVLARAREEMRRLRTGGEVVPFPKASGREG